MSPGVGMQAPHRCVIAQVSVYKPPCNSIGLSPGVHVQAPCDSDGHGVQVQGCWALSFKPLS